MEDLNQEGQDLYAIEYDCDITKIYEDQVVLKLFKREESKHWVYKMDTDKNREMPEIQQEIRLLQTFFISCAQRQRIVNQDSFKVYYNAMIPKKAEQAEQELSCFSLIFYGKRKQIIAQRYQNFLILKPHIRLLEMEWGKYKYLVLEHSKVHYDALRQLFREKSTYPVDQFYKILDEALQKSIPESGSLNAIDHVWGYFKLCATPKEKQDYAKLKEIYQKGSIKTKEIKVFLWHLTCKYKEPYLKESYFFFEIWYDEPILQ